MEQNVYSKIQIWGGRRKCLVLLINNVTQRTFHTIFTIQKSLLKAVVMPFVVRNESNYVESHLKFKNNIKLFHCALTRNLTIRKSNLKISILFYLKNHFIACSHTHAVVFLHYTVNMQTNKKLDPPFSTTARVHYRPHTYPASIRWVNVVQWRFFYSK